jgi:hypothetical protein
MSERIEIMTDLLTECLSAQRDAGFTFEDRREEKCPDCKAPGYNTGWGYWAFTCGAEILTCGEIDVPCAAGGAKERKA